VAVGIISHAWCSEYGTGKSHAEFPVRMISVLGGVYNPEALGRSVVVHVQSLIG
jgi:acetoin utilization deacetylase AcuC-like enzyme